MCFRATARIFWVVGFAALASACAEGAKPGAMMVNRGVEAVIQNDSPLHGSMGVTAVTGGEKTDPAWMSKVSNEDFEKALRLSLESHSMLSAEGDAPLMVSADLVALDQPFIGFDMTVTSIVAYTVKHAKNGLVFKETVTTPFTATMSDAFAGYQRLRIANEGAIRRNIQSFIKQIVERAKQEPEKFDAPDGQTPKLQTS